MSFTVLPRYLIVINHREEGLQGSGQVKCYSYKKGDENCFSHFEGEVQKRCLSL